MITSRNLKKYISYLLCSLLFYDAFSQSISKIPCYALAQQNNQAIELIEYNPDVIEWRAIGSTGKFNLKSIAIDSENSIIYSVDKHTLGTLNPVTGKFTTIGRIGVGDGAFGQVDMNNVYGLAWHPTEKILYATQQTSGYDSLDMLLKIDPANGKIIQAGFGSDDYVLLEKANGLSTTIPIYTVRAIAFQASTAELYTVYRQNNEAVLAILNNTNGKIEQLIKDVYFLDLNGICFDVQDRLYAAGQRDFIDNYLSRLYEIDRFTGLHELLYPFIPDSNDAYNILGMDCFKARPEIEFCSDNINLSTFFLMIK